MSDPVIFVAVMGLIAVIGWIVRVERGMISREEYEKKHDALEERVRQLEGRRK